MTYLSSISLSYNPWWIAGAVFVGIIYAFVLYYKQKQFDSSKTSLKKWIYLMSFLRFLTCSALAILLLNPILKQRTYTSKKPVLAILQDDSKSVWTHTKKTDSIAYREQINQLKKRLKDRYDIRSYAFADQVYIPNKGPTQNRQKTNISKALSTINERLYNQKVVGIILASDGLYNSGLNPLYTPHPYPIYSIAMGDTTQKKDIKIRRIRYNKVSYLGDKLQIKIDIEGHQSKDIKTQIQVRHINDSKKILKTQPIYIDKNTWRKTYNFYIDNSHIGVQQYQIRILPINQEINTSNNAKNIYVDILDNKIRVYIVAPNPHPDISALKNALEKKKTNEVKVIIGKDIKAYPKNSDVLILHNLPSKKYTLSTWKNNLDAHKTPILFFIGNKTDMHLFKQWRPNIKRVTYLNTSNKTYPQYNEKFNLFTLSPNQLQTLNKLSPLTLRKGNTFTYISNLNEQNTLIYQANKEQTIWGFDKINNQKTAYIAGEGIWKWRMSNYLLTEKHQLVDDLINKSVQYLAIKNKQKRFNISLHKKTYTHNENIYIQGQLYNESYELTNKPEVIFEFRKDDEEKQVYKMLRKGNQYSLSLKNLPEGIYSYEAKTQIETEGTPLVEKGIWIIKNIELENIETKANHKLLYTLSKQSKGYPFDINTINKLKDTLYQKDITSLRYENINSVNAHNMPFIFILILCMLGIEWSIRKYQGGY